MDLAKLRERLGLQADADEAAVEAAFNSVFEDATAFRAATEKANEARTFAEKYPDQAAKIERLEKRDREASIREFTERFERFKVKVGDGDEAVEREYGFAMPVIDKLRECARSFHEGGFGLDKVEDVLSTIAASGQDKAIVEFGERGSSRQAAETVSPDDAKKKVSDRVAELMKDDKLSRADAFRQAAEEMPDEVQAYRTGQPSPVGKDEE